MSEASNAIRGNLPVRSRFSLGSCVPVATVESKPSVLARTSWRSLEKRQRSFGVQVTFQVLSWVRESRLANRVSESNEMPPSTLLRIVPFCRAPLAPKMAPSSSVLLYGSVWDDNAFSDQSNLYLERK